MATNVKGAKSALDVRIGRGAKALLTSRTTPLAETMQGIILAEARKSGIVVCDITLSAFSDPEEDWKELVFEVHVAASPEEALAYWDQVGTAIDEWKSHLSERDADLLCERFSFDVIWA